MKQYSDLTSWSEGEQIERPPGLERIEDPMRAEVEHVTNGRRPGKDDVAPEQEVSLSSVDAAGRILFYEILPMKTAELRLQCEKAGIDARVMRKMKQKIQFLVAIITKCTGISMDRVFALSKYRDVEKMDEKWREKMKEMTRLRNKVLPLKDRWRSDIEAELRKPEKKATP